MQALATADTSPPPPKRTHTIPTGRCPTLIHVCTASSRFAELHTFSLGDALAAITGCDGERGQCVLFNVNTVAGAGGDGTDLGWMRKEGQGRAVAHDAFEDIGP